MNRNDILEITYDLDTDEVCVVAYNGYPTYYKLSDLELADADERELGTEMKYFIEPNIFVIFYPEGYLVDFYIEE